MGIASAVLLLISALLSCFYFDRLCVEGHKPVTDEASYGHKYSTRGGALLVDPINISHVAYRVVTCKGTIFWLEFVPPTANFSLYVGVGVPVLDRFASLRVDVAILGPGLPPVRNECGRREPQIRGGRPRCKRPFPAAVGAELASTGLGIPQIYNQLLPQTMPSLSGFNVANHYLSRYDTLINMASMNMYGGPYYDGYDADKNK
jgi:hypothetical protein